jgi:hypothetical protein
MTVRFLTKFSQRPLHILGTLGLLMLFAGMAGMLYLAWYWLTHPDPIGNRPLLTYSAALLGIGAQMLTLGVLAELVTFYNLRPKDTYSVAERIGPREEEPRDVV